MTNRWLLTVSEHRTSRSPQLPVGAPPNLAADSGTDLPQNRRSSAWCTCQAIGMVMPVGSGRSTWSLWLPRAVLRRGAVDRSCCSAIRATSAWTLTGGCRGVLRAWGAGWQRRELFLPPSMTRSPPSLRSIH